jgi:hypothetical protein
MSLDVRKALLDQGLDATVGSGSNGRVVGNVLAKRFTQADIDRMRVVIGNAMGVLFTAVEWRIEPFDRDYAMWAFVVNG